jgi:predicted NBD/HSP70 family sugar kinase
MHETAGRRVGPVSQQSMRRSNLALVLGEVASGPRSRAEVATATGLTRAAVSSLVEELIAGGLVAESGQAAPLGKVGRPGTVLVLNAEGPAGLGAEIGVDHMAVCVVDLRGEVRGWQRSEIRNHGRPLQAVVADLAALLGRVVEASGLSPVGLSLAVPGLVDVEQGVVLRAPRLGWEQVPLVAELRSALRAAGSEQLAGLPLGVHNEANLAGLAELWLGGRPEDFLFVSAEAGIGAAVVMDGRLQLGARGFAGELGHVMLDPQGPPCACGSRGCLEVYAGEAAVLEAAGLRGVRGDWVALVARRAANGDEVVRDALARAGRALGAAAALAVNLLDPAAVVLGGGYTELADWLLPAMRAELVGRVTVRPWSDEWLTLARVGRRGPLLGAAVGVVRAVVADPGRVPVG